MSPPSAKDRKLTELFGIDYLSSDGGESEAPGTSDVTSARIAGRATAALCGKLYKGGPPEHRGEYGHNTV